MSEEMIVRHCSPTLAGMKIGSIFSCSFSDITELRNYIRNLNQLLVKKGLRVLSLRIEGERALIYVYRPRRLTCDLSHATAAYLLFERDYDINSSDRCILNLMKRLKECEEFPHEIGLFLSYPPEDVHGFIKNKAEKCRHSRNVEGVWLCCGGAEDLRQIQEMHGCLLYAICERQVYRKAHSSRIT